MYYKDTFGPFVGVAKTIGYAAKTTMGLDEYNEGEQENDAIILAINPLAQIGIDTALIKFYWTLTQLQIAISVQNLQAGMNGSSKVSEMKEALRQLQATAQNLTTIAGEYDWEVG